MLIVEQELCRPGAEVNEDLVWHDRHYAAVLDGSSTLAGATHDAVGFVELFAKRFAAQAVRDMTLASCVNAAIASLRDEFVPSSYPEGIVPSAAGAFVRETDDALEVLSVADCTVVVLLRDGSTATVRDSAIDQLDAQVIKLACDIRSSTGQDISDVMRLPEVRAALLANRRLMNAPHGYRVLASNMRPLKGRSTRFDKADVERVLVHSDGFDRAAARLDLKDPELSLETLYQKLRAEELADPRLNDIPRFKISDDASALLLRIG